MRQFCQARALRRLLKDEESGERLTRSPKGFPAEHPAAALYRQKRWGFSASLEPEMATKPEFAKIVASYFRAGAPLVALLNRPLVMKAQRPRRPLFLAI